MTFGLKGKPRPGLGPIGTVTIPVRLEIARCDLAQSTSARFVSEHKKNPTDEISIYGQERVADRPPDEFKFAERLEELNEELEVLNLEAHELEDRIAEDVAKLLEVPPGAQNTGNE